MRCSAANPLLQSYLDGELDRDAVVELEAHLETCDRCRSELAALEELRTSIRSLPRYRAPQALRSQLEKIETMPEMAAHTHALRWRPWALAASMLFAFLLGGAVTWLGMSSSNRIDQQQALAQELLTSHLRALAAASPVDVISEDRHTVKPWFAGRIGESPPVVDLSAQDFPLLGGRIDYVAGRRTAVIVYRHRQHVIDVYLMPAEGKQESRQLEGYWVSTCKLGDRPAGIVTDIEERELNRFRDALACR